MARPSILGNAPPTEAEVNHALECCKAVPRIREELLAMEQEMSNIRERLDIEKIMTINDLFDQRGFVAVKLKNCIRERGFTKVSFARKAGISRPMLDELLEGNIDNERVFDDCVSRALDALNISEDGWACFEPKHKSTDTVCRESVPKDNRMSEKAQKQYGLLMDTLELCEIYY